MHPKIKVPVMHVGSWFDHVSMECIPADIPYAGSGSEMKARLGPPIPAHGLTSYDSPTISPRLLMS